MHSRGSLVGIAFGLSLLTLWMLVVLPVPSRALRGFRAGAAGSGNEPHALMSLVSGRVIRNDIVLDKQVEKGELLVELDADQVRFSSRSRGPRRRGWPRKRKACCARLRRAPGARRRRECGRFRARRSRGAASRGGRESARFARQEARARSKPAPRGPVVTLEPGRLGDGVPQTAKRRRRAATLDSRGFETTAGLRSANRKLSFRRRRRAAEIEATRIRLRPLSRTG